MDDENGDEVCPDAVVVIDPEGTELTPECECLWPQGESDFTGEVVARLDAFSTSCGKPTVHFFGHTHGYSRGQSRDHHHLWVNVSTAGGAIDRWGGSGQVNYPEYAVTQDTWGFVEIGVETGDAPRFTLRLISRGNGDAAADNPVTDELTVLRDGSPPSSPWRSTPLATG